MRHSMLTPNALGVAALVTFLAGCSGGSSQTPALSGSANSLGQAFARQVTSLRPFTPNTSHGFMQAIDARTHLLYMSSWGTASVVDVLTMNGKQVGQIARMRWPGTERGGGHERADERSLLELLATGLASHVTSPAKAARMTEGSSRMWRPSASRATRVMNGPVPD